MMSELPGDEKDAPEGYYAVKDVYFVKKPESTKQDSVPTTPSNISLRDFFAGCAISGFMNASEEVYKVPEMAYIVADMMLAEREKS